MLDFIINHQRFKKQFNQNELIKYLPDENIINRHGFEKLYSDTFIKSIYIYTGNKKGLINYYKTVKYDLNCAEKSRKFKIIKNCIKILIPFFNFKIN